MFDTPDEIRRQLEAGEDSRAEFKEVVLGDRGIRAPSTEEVAADMVAFANAGGGMIFLGVGDGGVVQGLPENRVADVESWVASVAANNCDPPIRPILRREPIVRPDGASAVVLLARVRLGSLSHNLKPEELPWLTLPGGHNQVFDEQPVFAATVDDLDRDRLKEYFGETRIPWPELLRNTRVVDVDELGIDRPTVAGLLAFSSKPRLHLPSAYIEAAVYRGTELTSDDLVHADTLEGRVDTQIDDAADFVGRFMLKPARNPAGREDYPQYDPGAVREAIVNAIAHRDYSIAGSKIRLFLFADRLELYSPGALPNTLTIETMPFRVFTRNQLLVSFLSRMKSRRTGRAFLESRGEGVRRILDVSEAHAGRRPVYELFGEEIRLTIWRSRRRTGKGNRNRE